MAWSIFVGDLPATAFVCHRCDNPPCVNPEHLFLGTRKDNTEDAISKNRFARGERSGQSKLTTEQVITIRSLAKSGVSGHKIATQFNVHFVTVYKIIRRVTWKHVPVDTATEYQKQDKQQDHHFS
jgi:hypothetical protein